MIFPRLFDNISSIIWKIFPLRHLEDTPINGKSDGNIPRDPQSFQTFSFGNCHNIDARISTQLLMISFVTLRKVKFKDKLKRNSVFISAYQLLVLTKGALKVDIVPNDHLKGPIWLGSMQQTQPWKWWCLSWRWSSRWWQWLRWWSSRCVTPWILARARWEWWKMIIVHCPTCSHPWSL